MSYKIVWKLCNQVNGRLISAAAWRIEMMLHYRIGESTKPRVGLLFAFKTKRDAYYGRSCINYSAIIVKCKARISKRFVPEVVAFQEDWLAYWKAILKGEDFNLGRNMPSGTVFCTEVIPIEIDNDLNLEEKK